MPVGGGRFLKTALCVHEDGGLVVVKVPVLTSLLDFDRTCMDCLALRI